MSNADRDAGRVAIYYTNAFLLGEKVLPTGTLGKG